jgi:thiol-disulfide isomerase/thioredoxin
MNQTLLILLLAVAAFSMKTVSNTETGYKVGDQATGFTLKNASNSVNGIGMNVTLEDYKNVKGFIVIFTCNHCPFAKAYQDRIIDLHKEYAPKGFPVVAINSNDVTQVPEDSYAEMKKLAKDKSLSYAYLYDETQEIAKTYGASRTPQVYILEKKAAKNYVRYIGAIDDNTYAPADVKEKYVVNALEDLLKNGKVTKDYTRAVGCTIKWKE